MLHLELGRATAVPLATPAKLGHDPIYLRVIGRVHNVQLLDIIGPEKSTL